ncbi:hypothetical protein LCGC14_1747320 [marine sediment metagenome]|uniref:GATA-type domain-containing protein n=1 Tax=marine sediment metagenome TaxID=412755 RepID=A0A0F9HSA1_9ZZZZ
MEKTKCSICGTEESKGWLGNSNGTYCNACSKDVSDFNFQPKNHFNVELLAEVFFRKGQREKITYKQLHEEKSSLKFIEFPDLFKMKEKIANTK